MNAIIMKKYVYAFVILLCAGLCRSNLCASHGNPLTDAEADFEVVVAPTKAPTIAERLEALLNEGESEEEDEETARVPYHAHEESDDEIHLDQEEYEEED